MVSTGVWHILMTLFSKDRCILSSFWFPQIIFLLFVILVIWEKSIGFHLPNHMLILLNPLILYIHMYGVPPFISLSMETVTFFCLLMTVPSLYGFFSHNHRFFSHSYNFITWSKHNSIQPSRVYNQTREENIELFPPISPNIGSHIELLVPTPMSKTGLLKDKTCSLWRKDSHSLITLLSYIPSRSMLLKQPHTSIIEPLPPLSPIIHPIINSIPKYQIMSFSRHLNVFATRSSGLITTIKRTFSAFPAYSLVTMHLTKAICIIITHHHVFI